MRCAALDDENILRIAVMFEVVPNTSRISCNLSSSEAI